MDEKQLKVNKFEKAIPDEELANVNGGMVVITVPGSTPECKWAKYKPGQTVVFRMGWILKINQIVKYDGCAVYDAVIVSLSGYSGDWHVNDSIKVYETDIVGLA